MSKLRVTTRVRGGSMTDVDLDVGHGVRFHLPSGDYVEVRTELVDGHLSIRCCDGRLTLAPHAANLIYLKVEGF